MTTPRRARGLSSLLDKYDIDIEIKERIISYFLKYIYNQRLNKKYNDKILCKLDFSLDLLIFCSLYEKEFKVKYNISILGFFKLVSLYVIHASRDSYSLPASQFHEILNVLGFIKCKRVDNRRLFRNKFISYKKDRYYLTDKAFDLIHLFESRYKEVRNKLLAIV